MERENVEKYLKENLKCVSVKPRKIVMGGCTILEPVIFLEFKDGSKMRFFWTWLEFRKMGEWIMKEIKFRAWDKENEKMMKVLVNIWRNC